MAALTALGRGDRQSGSRRKLAARVPPDIDGAARQTRPQHLVMVIGCVLGKMSHHDLPWAEVPVSYLASLVWMTEVADVWGHSVW